MTLIISTIFERLKLTIKFAIYEYSFWTWLHEEILSGESDFKENWKDVEQSKLK